MARIETRSLKSGRKRYRVWWRLGGSRSGEPQSETFQAKPRAVTFKLAVEAAGHQWPADYTPGVGWDHEVESAERRRRATPPHLL